MTVAHKEIIMVSVGRLLLARAPRLPYTITRRRITPLAESRTNYLWSANLTTYKRISSSSTMTTKFSMGEDEGKLKAETRTLLDNGWLMDKDEMGVEKTYHFKTYTKCQVELYSHIYCFC